MAVDALLNVSVIAAELVIKDEITTILFPAIAGSTV
jgi:hypothetical protein